jgi:DNA excision repair protein ERCC-6
LRIAVSKPFHDTQTKKFPKKNNNTKGLGKTVQIISFLSGLSRSQKLDGPVLILAPATVLKQWANEFQNWWPALRVVILHSSGCALASGGSDGSAGTRGYDEEETEEEETESEEERGNRTRTWDRDRDRDRGWGRERGRGFASASKNKKRRKVSAVKKKVNPRVAAQVSLLVERVVEKGHVILTTYDGLRSHRQTLLPVRWAYCVLDEGHKIRNADADITLVCKRIKVCKNLSPCVFFRIGVLTDFLL